MEQTCAPLPLRRREIQHLCVVVGVLLLTVKEYRIMPKAERNMTAKTAQSQSEPPAVM